MFSLSVVVILCYHITMVLFSLDSILDIAELVNYNDFQISPESAENLECAQST